MPTTEREFHFTAHVEIKRVLHAVPQETRHNMTQTPQLEREVLEVTDIVVRSTDLDTLKDKLQKHIELIEED